MLIASKSNVIDDRTMDWLRVQWYVKGNHGRQASLIVRVQIVDLSRMDLIFLSTKFTDGIAMRSDLFVPFRDNVLHDINKATPTNGVRF